MAGVAVSLEGGVEAHAYELLCGNPDYLRLRQVPGIGPIHALTILAEAGDLRRFGHHRQFLKFCGLDLATHQSGQFRGQTRLSKYGNARLRRTFWLAAQVAIRQRDNSLRDCFGRHIAKDRENKDLRRRQPSPSLPRWRVLFMPLSRPEQITGPSKRGRCQVEEPGLHGPWRRFRPRR